MSAIGRIFDVQRFALHDGPGIRTCVFLKGCPLRCQWCHNPESQRSDPELSFDASRCVGCAACVPICPQAQHAVGANGHALARTDCTTCGACAAACPQNALRVIGRETTASEVIAVLERDRAYIERSSGGLTLSGGEPLAQVAFARDLCRLARARGFHTAIETSAYAPAAVIAQMLPLVDLWLVDWKCSDAPRHRVLTGVDNAPIRAALQQLSAAGAAIILRCPLIPGLNDDDVHLDGIADLARELVGLRAVELMPYHDLGVAKASRIGREAPCPRSGASAAQVQSWIQRLAERGCSACAG